MCGYALNCLFVCCVFALRALQHWHIVNGNCCHWHCVSCLTCPKLRRWLSSDFEQLLLHFIIRMIKSWVEWTRSGASLPKELLLELIEATAAVIYIMCNTNPAVLLIMMSEWAGRVSLGTGSYLYSSRIDAVWGGPGGALGGCMFLVFSYIGILSWGVQRWLWINSLNSENYSLMICLSRRGEGGSNSPKSQEDPSVDKITKFVALFEGKNDVKLEILRQRRVGWDRGRS